MDYSSEMPVHQNGSPPPGSQRAPAELKRLEELAAFAKGTVSREAAILFFLALSRPLYKDYQDAEERLFDPGEETRTENVTAEWLLRTLWQHREFQIEEQYYALPSLFFPDGTPKEVFLDTDPEIHVVQGCIVKKDLTDWTTDDFWKAD